MEWRPGQPQSRTALSKAFLTLNKLGPVLSPSPPLSPAEPPQPVWASGQQGVTLVLDSASSDIQVNYSLLADTCNLWRNYDDIQDSWSSVLSILDWFVDNQDILQPVAGPGHWNDPDMVHQHGGRCPQAYRP